ncbi:MAG: 23S rRNA (pseudouridine(1915)-N(3))-methyltransferase RlmH [Clostridia bacterium]|nr:23S rRNA (pseudouridine(1915)-N(3))-methyltransferase RlmH [Clostridia bacterium]
MKVNIVCIGKIKEKFFIDAILEYKKRLSRFCTFNIVEIDEVSKEMNTLKKNEIEGKRLLEKSSGIIVSMDSRGKMLSSNEIADYIKDKQVMGCSEITFIIGGSNGLSKEVLDKSSLILSFGKITFPHQLFRVVLTEQIYRAFTIISGLPYHK